MEKNRKSSRILGIYTKLLNGSIVNKFQEAQRYGVDERSIQRDIDTIRSFLDQEAENSGVYNCVYYDRIAKGYRLEQIFRMKFENSEILAICKILLDSRAFTREEMQKILQKLIEWCVPKCNQKLVQSMIQNEMFHYVEPRHKTVFLDTMWEIAKAIHTSRWITFSYMRMQDKKQVKRKVKPVAILFNEYYFYLTAFIEDEKTREHFDVLNDAYPTIYRIDRIQNLKVLKEHYHIPYKDRFEEGEFRKRIQFMYGGRLRRVEFQYSGAYVEAVLDKLPTAKILKEEDGIFTIQAEVFGDGIEMWLRSQGDLIKNIRYR